MDALTYATATAALAEKFPLLMEISEAAVTAPDSQASKEEKMVVRLAHQLVQAKFSLNRKRLTMIEGFEMDQDSTASVTYLLTAEAEYHVAFRIAQALEFHTSKEEPAEDIVSAVRDLVHDELVYGSTSTSTSPVHNAVDLARLSAWRDAARLVGRG